MTARILNLEKMIRKFEKTSLFMYNLVEGRKQLFRRQLKKWPQLCRRNQAIVCNRVIYGELLEH